MGSGFASAMRPGMTRWGNLTRSAVGPPTKLGRPAAPDAGAAGAFVFEQIGEAFEHHAAQLLGVDDGDGAAVVAGDVVADADRGQLYLAGALDVVDHLAQVLFEVVAGVDRQRRVVDRGAV